MEQQTHIYKQVAGLDIAAEVFARPDSPAPRPVVISIHGGALMGGERAASLDLLGQRLLEAGCAVVDIDYRLAPETRLPEIIADVVDAHAWVRTRGPALFGADPARIATKGGSAGGYLALVCGYAVRPRPRAVVSFYGYGDIVGSWYTEPSPFYCEQAPPITEAEARAVVGTTPITRPPDALVFERLKFYHYCRQQGLWPREVTGGLDPATQPDAFDRFCPVRNVTAEYPPTLLLHGEKDTDVPCAQSLLMADALAAADVEHELATYPEGFHCFDLFWRAEQYQHDALDAIDRATRFLLHHLR